MTTALESLPSTWSPADDSFFRVVAAVFSPEFTAGAGVLLSSYDDELLDVAPDAVSTPSAQRADRVAERVTA